MTVEYSKAGYDGSTTYTITIDGSTAMKTDSNLLDGNADGTAGDNYLFTTV